jgi:hypothetical protein
MMMRVMMIYLDRVFLKESPMVSVSFFGLGVIVLMSGASVTIWKRLRKRKLRLINGVS